MPRKRKSLAPETPLTPVPVEILDQFVRQGPLSVEELDGAARRFKKAIVERALGGELTHHLGYAPGGAKPEDVSNHRNGTSPKTVLTDDGSLALEVPRDREGTFEPRLIPKHARRFAGFDDKILALYARGMTVREIQAFLADMYAVEVSPDLISTVNRRADLCECNLVDDVVQIPYWRQVTSLRVGQPHHGIGHEGSGDPPSWACTSVGSTYAMR